MVRFLRMNIFLRLNYSSMSDEGMKRRITFSFLEDIKIAWREKFGSVEQTAIAFSLNEQFSPILKQKIVRFHLVCNIF